MNHSRGRANVGRFYRRAQRRISFFTLRAVEPEEELLYEWVPSLRCSTAGHVLMRWSGMPCARVKALEAGGCRETSRLRLHSQPADPVACRNPAPLLVAAMGGPTGAAGSIWSCLERRLDACWGLQHRRACKVRAAQPLRSLSAREQAHQLAGGQRRPPVCSAAGTGLVQLL